MTDKLDTSFEIITLKEKYLKEQLEIAEENLMKSEYNVSINEEIIRKTKWEIEEEHKKTQ